MNSNVFVLLDTDGHGGSTVRGVTSNVVLANRWRDYSTYNYYETVAEILTDENMNLATL